MYDLNSELKQKIRLYVSRKRCNRCYAAFEKNCIIYFCGIELFQEKTRFAVNRKPSEDSLINLLRQPFANALVTNQSEFVKSFNGSRISFSSKKERDLRRVLSVEIYCSKCSNYRILEIDLDGFLSKQFSKAVAITPEEDTNQIEEFDEE